MSEHDDLRVRLARLDPAPDSLAPVGSPRAQELLERIMSTPVVTPTPDEAPAAPRRRMTLAAVAAAAALVAGGGVVAGVALSGGSSHPKTAGTTLSLKLPAGGPGMSCMRFDVSILRDMPLAFGGTATEVGDTSVTLTVDHWYKGGSADTVTLTKPGIGSGPAMEFGVAFEQGQRYLVTATDGNVNGCGYTGPADADLEQAFTQAFG